MRLFGYPYNDLVICKDSPDYLLKSNIAPVQYLKISIIVNYKFIRNITISNTRATFAYHSFYDNLWLHVMK